LLLLARIRDALDHRGASQGDAVVKAQGRNRDIEAGPGDAGRSEVDLIGPHLRQAEPVGRLVKVLGEFRHGVHVAALRHRRQVADLHVVDHAAAQRVHLDHRAISWFRLLDGEKATERAHVSQGSTRAKQDDETQIASRLG